MVALCWGRQGPAPPPMWRFWGGWRLSPQGWGHWPRGQRTGVGVRTLSSRLDRKLSRLRVTSTGPCHCRHQACGCARLPSGEISRTDKGRAGGWVWPGGGGLPTPGLEGSGHEPAARVGEEPERGVEHERSAAAAARQARAPLVCYMHPQRSSCKGCRSDDAQDVRVPLRARLIELEMRSSACPLLSNYCHRHPPLSLESVETVTVSVSPLGDGLSGH